MGFLLLVHGFFRPVEKINAVLEIYPKGIAGFRRYTELLDIAPDIVDRPDARAVVVCSGNANACTGDQGVADAERMCRLTSDELGCLPSQVLVAST